MNSQSQYQGTIASLSLSADGQKAAAAIAQRHSVGLDAVATLISAIALGGGSQAQFSHPDLGGMGQWSRGGMLMIGDMFNQGLKAKVAAVCEEVAGLIDAQGHRLPGETSSSLFADGETHSAGHVVWPEDLGIPASTGSQNDMHYAVFPQTCRLAVVSGGILTIYDTGDHRIGGLGQQQGATGSITLESQHGPVRLEDLAVVRETGAMPSKSAMTARQTEQDNRGPGSDMPSHKSSIAMAPPAPVRSGPDDHSEIFAKIEGLAGLHAKGYLTDQEFHEKKSELLARL